MNELQLGLIGAGAVIVIGVVIYNGFQGRRARRRLPRTMPPTDASAQPFDTQEEPPFIQPSVAARRRDEPVEPGLGGSPGGTIAAGEPRPVNFGADDSTSKPVWKPVNKPNAKPAEKPASKQGGRGDASVRREPTFGGTPSADELAAAADFPADLPAEAASPEWAAGMAQNAAEEGRAQQASSAEGDAALMASVGANAAVPLAQGDPDVVGAAPNGGAGRDGADFRGEPSFGGNASAPASAPASAAVTDTAETDHEPIEPATSTISNLPPVIVDRRIDCIVLLALDEIVSGERVMPLAIRFRRAGSKPVYVEGRDEDGHWGTLRPGARYRELRAAVQLANRSGPLNELEFSEFVGGVHRLADALDAAVEFPEMSEIVQMARELDGFAAQCDAQLSVNVLSDGAPWSGSYVQAVASQDGLLLSRDGTRFVKLDAQQNPVFTLTFEGTNFLRDDLTYKGGHMITLLLDVPVADEDIMPWRLMCDYARSLAQRIGARVVDDQRRVLPDASLQAIDERLMTLYARLESANIPAGSPAARRLFSA